MRDVVIVGAGPTGLMLAGELALAGVDVLLIERRLDQRLTGSRAGGLHARSLEVLDQRGIVGRFLAEGQVAQAVGFAFNRLDISDFPTRHNYVLGLWQKHIERILAGWVAELPVEVRRGDEVVGLAQDAEGVDVRLGDGEVVRARCLVGCDGGRSVVRKATGIEFAGWDAAMSSLLAEVEMTQVPPFGVHRTAVGLHSFGRVDYEIRDGVIVYAETGPVTVMVSEAKVGAEGEPGLADLRAALIAACGTDYGLQRAQWVSRFTDMSRQAVQYRQGRVLLAGDAAHVHGPHGGQGLNTGVQDAVNLGWKLAQVVKGVAGEGLLDSYHAERHPVAARVLRNTMRRWRFRDRTSGARLCARPWPIFWGWKRRGGGWRECSRGWISAMIWGRATHCWGGGCRTLILSRRAGCDGCTSCCTPRGGCWWGLARRSILRLGRGGWTWCRRGSAGYGSCRCWGWCLRRARC